MSLTGFPSQCGMAILHGLDEYQNTLDDQVARLSGALISKCQVVLSDRISNKRWKELKTLAFRGPARRNPNSGGKVQVYICTRETLDALQQYRDAVKKQKRGKPDINEFIPEY